MDIARQLVLEEVKLHGGTIIERWWLSFKGFETLHLTNPLEGVVGLCHHRLNEFQSCLC